MNMWPFSVLLVELLLSLVLSALGIYHWARATFYEPNVFYSASASAFVLITGLSSSFHAGLGLIASLYRGLRRLSTVFTRMTLIVSIPATVSLVKYIISLAARITPPQQSRSFMVAEIIISLLILMAITITLYPASNTMTNDSRPSFSSRRMVVAPTVLTGVAAAIHIGLAGYNLYHIGINVYCITAVMAASLLLTHTIGALVAAHKENRSYVIPYIITSVVVFQLFNGMTLDYAAIVYQEHVYGFDYGTSYNVYLAMFAFNWLILAGMAFTVPVLGIFAFY